ncbi:DUF4269 domain-containing protein [Flavobacterium seoulense]|uniref:Diadenosine tetraphosphate hydrolase n=1 Tax=Flavobacterium seoulense TaxID=1492738 RepID=A0A066WV62_9FLAO|nr:DUF4269 domain-containing protein [Flavobacterium seoulense]KDN56478.1 hypothetical protein FEM21_04970 [Flavobacterium seoulense]
MATQNIDFDNITYLQSGNFRQQQAYTTLKNNQILLKLQDYNPILVGTIPINIDIENSDLDIICFTKNKEEFKKLILANFSNEKNFTIRERVISGNLAIIANFIIDEFEIEIFGQNIPVKQQFGYRHMLIEDQLLKEHGEQFRQKIIALKQQGHKTEPAFGIALGLTGNPYLELLRFEKNNNKSNL